GFEIVSIEQTGGGDVAVTNDGSIVIAGTIETADTVNLASTSTITESGAGRIIAGALATRSAGGLTLGGANEIGQFAASNDGGAITLVNAVDGFEIVSIEQTNGGDVAVT